MPLTGPDVLRHRVGWIAVGVSTLLACLWAAWGIIENFHEGWYSRSLVTNLQVMAVQYLPVMALFTVMAAVAARWPRPGGLLHAAGAFGAAWFFRGASWMVLGPFIVGPLILLGAAHWYGRPQPRRRAVGLALILPLITLIVAGVGPAVRVATRRDDGDRGPRRVTAEGVDLVWAPQGPGWPLDGVSWTEARDRCRRLAPDGVTLADTIVDAWRLPTVDEAVRAMARHGVNAGGRWDAGAQRATFARTPDKESPLWDPYSKVIYWWTADEVDSAQAMIVVYNGTVWPRPRAARWGYLGFRAVRAPEPDPNVR